MSVEAMLNKAERKSSADSSDTPQACSSPTRSSSRKSTRSSDTPRAYESSLSSGSLGQQGFIKRKIKKMYTAISQDDSKEFLDLYKIISEESDENIMLLVKPITGMNLLHTAARYGSDEILKILIEKGLRNDIPCARNIFYMTPLMFAVYFSTVEIGKWEKFEKTIKLLINYFSVSDIDQEDGLKRTALHWAAMRGTKRVIQLLLEHGSDRNKTDVYGFTPLHYIIEAILNAGGNYTDWKILASNENINVQCNAQYSFHRTVLHMVADQAADCKKFLRGAGTPYKNEKLRTDLAKEIVEFGADKTLLDNHGKRPIDLAVNKGTIESGS